MQGLCNEKYLIDNEWHIWGVVEVTLYITEIYYTGICREGLVKQHARASVSVCVCIYIYIYISSRQQSSSSLFCYTFRFRIQTTTTI
jgi:hypothetical protein